MHCVQISVLSLCMLDLLPNDRGALSASGKAGVLPFWQLASMCLFAMRKFDILLARRETDAFPFLLNWLVVLLFPSRWRCWWLAAILREFAASSVLFLWASKSWGQCLCSSLFGPRSWWRPCRSWWPLADYDSILWNNASHKTCPNYLYSPVMTSLSCTLNWGMLKFW